jgi:hypothetical protein
MDKNYPGDNQNLQDTKDTEEKHLCLIHLLVFTSQNIRLILTLLFFQGHFNFYINESV